MSKTTVTQVNATRNQSTAQIKHENIFLGNNDFDEVTLTNAAAVAEITAESGQLLFKSAAGTVDVLDAAANIANVIGVMKVDGSVAVANAASLDVNVCLRGDIAEDMIDVSNVALNTVIPTTNRTLRDHLNSLGFHLHAQVDNTKQDNA